MSTRRLIFHPGVEEDLADVVAYYGEIDPSLGEERLDVLAVLNVRRDSARIEDAVTGRADA